MTTLIKSATIIDIKSEFHLQKKDILIADGIIQKISDTIKEEKDYHIVNLENLHVSNGWFDTSVCFGEPGFEERETIKNGLNVAAKSGFTAVAIQPNTNPITDTKASIEFIKNKKYNSVDIYPIGALSQQSKGIEMAELYDMQQSGAIAFGDYKTSIENDNLLKIALLYAQNFNGLVISFPKNNKIAQQGIANEGINATTLGLKGIPNLAEEIQVSRDLFLLEYTGGKLHIPTISTAKSVELIKQAKERGLQVTCSVAVHNLLLTDNELHIFDAKYKVNPPLRTENDRLALINGVKNGTIDIITSDHAPIDIEHKKVAFSMAKDGTIGLESAFGALRTIFDVETIVKCLSDHPKRIFKIETSIIAENKKANLSLFNPEGASKFTEENILSSSKNSIFLERELNGKVYGTFNNKLLILNN